MKIAILYICTGKYNRFFEGFYKSAECFFLKGIAEKEYYVFTDDMELSKENNVHLMYKKYEGFPLDSLFRFDMFLRVKDEVLKCDYAYFFNANMRFVAPVGTDFLPKTAELTAVIHPGFYNKPNFLYPYERNRDSLAYIPPYKCNYKYYMGSLNGGQSDAFIRFAEVCAERTHTDYDKGIIAMVHDESHLNKYMRDVNGEGLSIEYAVPEGKDLHITPKIILLNKSKILPDCSDFTKGRNYSLCGRLVKYTLFVLRAIRWYLYI